MNVSDAIMKGDLKKAEFYLKSGRKPNKKDANSLIFRGINKGDVEMLNLLFRYGFDVNTTNAKGWTPLIHAVFNNKEDIANLLMTYNPDVNIANTYGYTAIMDAIQKNHPRIVELLLNNGAYPLYYNKYGENVYSFLEGLHPSARSTIFNILKSSLESPELTEPYTGISNLMLHAYLGNLDLNLDNVSGKIINQTDRQGRTALMYAANQGHYDTVDLLLEMYNADPNIIANDGTLAIDYTQDESIIDLLISYGSKQKKYSLGPINISPNILTKVEKGTNIAPLRDYLKPNLRGNFSSLLNTNISSISELSNATFKRGGVIPYYILNGNIYYVLGVDAQSKDLSDFGGTLSQNEDPLIGAIRELKEESKSLIPVYMDNLYDSHIAWNSKMFIIFMPISIDDYLYLEKNFHLKPATKRTEMVDHLSLSPILMVDIILNGRTMIDQRRKKMYSLVRDFLNDDRVLNFL